MLTDGYFVHEVNPNDTQGGGACLVSGGQANEDCAGRWINFHRTQTEYAASPYAVICEKHLREVVENFEDQEVQTQGDPLPLRQYTPITAEDVALEPFAGVAGIRVEI